MSGAVNLKPEDISVRVDFNRHVALPFKRSGKRVDYIAFEGEGPQHVFSSEAAFDAVYSHSLDADPRIFIPKFLKAAKRAFLPGGDVAAILLEVLSMTTLNGKALKDATVSQLTEHYNVLRAAQGLEPVGEKCFNKKALLVTAIEKAEAEAAATTPEQVKNKEVSQASAEKRLSGLAALKEQKAEEAARKHEDKAALAASKENTMATAKKLTAPKTAPKKTAPKAAAPAKKAPAKAAPKAKAEGKGRGMGIGAFCIEQILKGKANGEVAEAAVEKFGGNTTASSVAWYRNKLKAEGKLK